ncbi:MAG: hypothetical protein JO292_07010, partial [Betaproteobacteria bacterium]|nr:hypothetical protein [Betaproteobacteria bacterium]
MKPAALALIVATLAGCASTGDVYRDVTPGMASNEVVAHAGKPTTVGKLVDGGAYWDYSRQPYYTSRVSFGADDRVRDVRNLLTEQNFENLQPGMTLQEVVGVVGPAFIVNRYGNGTTVWTYRYYDGVYKLLHATFDDSGHLLRYQTEWNPDVY